MDVGVRVIEAAEVARIAGIEVAADELLIQRFGPELIAEVLPGEARVAQAGFVLVVGRPCVGFAHVLQERDSAHLQQLAVDPAHGRRGLGTALVQACCEQARLRGHDELTLTTFRDIAFNAPWYARLGFVEVDDPVGVLAQHVEQERPYAQLSPRVAMSKRLTRGLLRSVAPSALAQ